MIHSYPWYIADWRNSETRLNLTLEERGLYRELLDFCYSERSLPSDERKLARIANCSDEEFARCWPAVETLFNKMNDRYRHSKVDEVLGKLDGYHEQRRQAGVLSGERRRNARSTTEGTLVDSSLPKKATKNEPSSTSTSTSTSKEEPPTPFLASWQMDETFVPFVAAWKDVAAETGKSLIDDDYADAWFRWKGLSMPQRIQATTAVRDKMRFGYWTGATDPQFISLPKKFLEIEWKRPVLPMKPKNRSKSASYDENAVDYPELPTMRRTD